MKFNHDPLKFTDHPTRMHALANAAIAAVMPDRAVRRSYTVKTTC
jgi:hypothetical protein